MAEKSQRNVRPKGCGCKKSTFKALKPKKRPKLM